MNVQESDTRGDAQSDNAGKKKEIENLDVRFKNACQLKTLIKFF